MMIDLQRELAAALRAMSRQHDDRLAALGIDRIDLALGMVGVGAVRRRGSADVRDQGALFEPVENGVQAFLTPVRVDSAFSPESRVPDSAVRVGELVDIVAWRPEAPERWALRRGVAEWLGAVDPQYLEPARVPIWRSPLRWLVSGAVGLVPLSCQPTDVYRLLASLRRIVPEDAQHATALRRTLTRPCPVPTIIARQAA